MKSLKKIVSLLLSVMITASLLSTVPLGVNAAEETGGTVTVTSNVCDTAVYTYDEYTKQITLTFSLQTDYLIENQQTSLTYDNSVLQVADANSLGTCMPVLGSGGSMLNLDLDNEIVLNSSITEDFYNFTQEAVYFTVTFDIIGSGDTTVNFNVEILTGNENNSSYYLINEDVIKDDLFTFTSSAKLIKAAFYARSISFSGNIALNFYMQLPDFVLNDDGAYMKFILPESSTATEVPLNSALKVTINGITCYRFSCGVSAKEMTQDIKAQFMRSDGSAATEERTFTVVDYANIIINGSYTEKQKNLIKSMLNYGGYAQEYFGYQTDNLANKDLNLELSSPVIDDTYKTNRTANTDSITYGGSSLIMETETIIRHYFYLTGDVNDFNFICDDTVLTPVYTGTNNLYYVDIKNISARNLRTIYKLIINDGEYEISYSPYTYIKLITEGNYNDKTKNMVSALYQYGEAANAYFAG